MGSSLGDKMGDLDDLNRTLYDLGAQDLLDVWEAMEEVRASRFLLHKVRAKSSQLHECFKIPMLYVYQKIFTHSKDLVTFTRFSPVLVLSQIRGMS